MQEDDFLLFLQHFQKHTKVNKKNKIFLLLDNYSSHISVKGIDFCKKNGIVLLTFPPHCSHKMQPLDRTVYGPFKKLINFPSDAWMKMNPAKPMTIYDIPGLVKTVFPSAMTPRNIQSGFEVTGLWPFNLDIFQECDFAAAQVTNRPNPNNVTERQQAPNFECPTEPPINAASINVDKVNLMPNAVPLSDTSCSSHCFDASDRGMNIPSFSSENCVALGIVNSTGIDCNESASIEQPCTSSNTEFSPSALRPRPKAGSRKGTKKKSGKRQSEILTETPVREKLAEEEARKKNGEAKKLLIYPKKDSSKPAKAKPKKMPGRKPRKKTTSTLSSSDEDDWFCIVCMDTYNNSKPGEKWTKCSYCEHWAHEACTEGGLLFVCVHCESDSEF